MAANNDLLIYSEEFMQRNDIRRKRIPLIWVLCPIFVIVMIGYLWIDQIKGDISQLKVTVTELNISNAQLTREYNALVAEKDAAKTDEYIIAKARQLYGYMMPNELLFVVSNPEALYTDGVTANVTEWSPAP